MTTKDKLKNHLNAGFAGLYVTSPESQRVEGEVSAAAEAEGFTFYTWSCTRGVMRITPAKGNKPAEATPLPANQEVPPHYAALDTFDAIPKTEKAVMLLHGYNLFLTQPDPVLYQRLKDSLLIGKMCSHTMIVVGCTLNLPPDLEKEITVVEFKLPDRDQINGVLDGICTSAKIELNGNRDNIIDACCGGTTTEIENWLALAVIEAGGKDIDPKVVAREKADTVKKNGILEIVEQNVSLDDIGGLEFLKADLNSKRHLFTKAARDYGLDTPRGILVVGQSGTGKSLTAAATKLVFNLPLLRLEAGRIFGGTVGESERNWRTAFATVRSCSPCILWVDEVCGLFAGAESSGRSDGGTTARVIKNILQDMQFNGEGIFFVFTANDVDKLPDPLIDRLDVWSVDLPTRTERSAIWSIHIAKRKRKPSKFPLDALADASEGFSGRQIEQVWLKAMTSAFNDGGREPTVDDVLESLKSTVPTSRLMADQIERRRLRLLNKAQPASAGEPVPQPARKIVK